MKKLCVIVPSDEARTFGDYLTSLGVENQVDPVDGGFEVWVYDEDKIAKAKQEYDQFLTNPSDKIYQQAGRKAKEIHKQKERDEKQRRKFFVDVRTQYSDSSENNLTRILLVICIVIFAYLHWGGPKVQHNILSALYFDFPYLRYREFLWIKQGEVWRFFSPIFIHFTNSHIIFNSIGLWFLGSIIERKKGTKIYLFIILFIAFLSNTAQYIDSGATFGGMSGVLYGFLGYIWMKMKFQPYEGIWIDPVNIIIMIGFMILCIFGALDSILGRAANTCHVVGLLSGMSIVYVPYWLKKKNFIK